MFSAPVAALVAQNGLPHRSEEGREEGGGGEGEGEGAAAAPAYQRRERRGTQIDGARYFRVGAGQGGAAAGPVAGKMSSAVGEFPLFIPFSFSVEQSTSHVEEMHVIRVAYNKVN